MDRHPAAVAWRDLNANATSFTQAIDEGAAVHNVQDVTVWKPPPNRWPTGWP
jgi:hypothetical protein